MESSRRQVIEEQDEDYYDIRENLDTVTEDVPSMAPMVWIPHNGVPMGPVFSSGAQESVPAVSITQVPIRPPERRRPPLIRGKTV